MSSAKHYTPSERESHWYEKWMEEDLFSSTPDSRTPFTIVIPPPNVTGILHMGHTLNNSIQDILTRRARMMGKNACWVPGTDHASIATEAKVVALLKEKGLDKFEIGREKFLEHAFEWKEKYGGIILEQLKKLGTSCDWSRTSFTMDPIRYKSVIDVFVRLHEKGLIYKGTRMVNWDPIAKTAVSDEEVFHKSSTDKLYYIKYQVADSDKLLQIATTRPETIMADAAICVHPDDERYKSLVGNKAIIPLIKREIPIIADEYVDIEFGTGCLKITPAHDINDYNIGQKFGLDIIDILNDDGTLNEKAQIAVGLDRAEARKVIAEKLKSANSLEKTEPIEHNVGHSERSGAVIEPKISVQWFCKMSELATPALDVVMQDEVQFHPAKLKNTYRHWMENIKDWCISRQLWWGHRIPVWYLPDGSYVVAHDEKEALKKAQDQHAELSMGDLTQENDVLDTWFSSWLWPLSVFDGVLNPENEEIKYYYPTDVVVTAPEIIFFWVARMIMAGQDYRDKIPFKHVYFTGIVRDEQGRKMSKSLGNSPDLFKLIDKHGADGVRFGILISSPAGNDLLFDAKLCDQGSAFINKIWNAHRLIDSWIGFERVVDSVDELTLEKNTHALALFNAKLDEAIVSMEDSYSKFKISDCLQTVYRLIWNDFCSHLLEWIKPSKETFIDQKSYEKCKYLFSKCLQLLHPFMPFITEELFQVLAGSKEYKSISVSDYPTPSSSSYEQLIKEYNLICQIETDVRSYKVQQQIPLRQAISCGIHSEEKTFFHSYKSLISHACGLVDWKMIEVKPENKKSFLSGVSEFFDFNSNTQLDETEILEIEKEIKRLKGFLFGIEKKLSNEKFVSNAPENVLKREQEKKNDTESKLKTLEEKLKR